MTAQQLQELREKRAALVAEARKLQDAAEQGKRDLSAEEEQRTDAIYKEVDTLKATIEAEERKGERRSRLEAEEAELESSAGRRSDPNPPERRSAGGGDGAALTELRSLHPRWRDMPENMARTLALRNTADYGREFRNYLATGREQRALAAGVDTQGGYLAPAQFTAQLIRALDDALFIRRLATVMPVTDAQELGQPSLEANPADADWTSEVLTGSEDTTMALGKRTWKPSPLAKLVKVSKKLLRASAIPIEALIRDRLAYKFGVAQEKAFLTGTGVGQPLGLFTASAAGITTARDVATNNSTTAFTFDGLIDAQYSVKAQYQAAAQWLLHRDGVKMARKLKNGDGQYIWQPSTQMGQPDMLLGKPVNQSEYAPNTFTAGLYVGLYGDFSYYWIADNLNLEIQALVELYAATNQNGYIGRAETDGMPVLAEAFARVKLATS